MMNATLYGEVHNPVVVIAGGWDPILVPHLELVDRLVDYAREQNRASMIVMFDPSPSLFILKAANPQAKWITYNEADVTMQLFFARGVDAILRVHFIKDYLDLGVAEFLTTITAHAQIAELWFGARQSFGRGEIGSQGTLISMARRQGIRLRKLAEVDTQKMGYTVRSFLQEGCPARTVEYTNTLPIRTKPLSGKLSLPWMPGLYRAIPLKVLVDPFHLIEQGEYETIDLIFRKKGTGSEVDWPNPEINYLAFVSGPQDMPVIRTIA